jgi:ubiquinone biosynthesis UbiH/UbiF/VisC/COQ6 family hydroxylase
VGGEHATLRLADGGRITASLVVGAEGARSWVRQAMAMASTVKPYSHLGVVANFATSLPHDGVAWEWFRPDGVLAYLPLPGARMSMVWSTEEAHGRKLLALPGAELAARVAEAGGHALGELSVITPAQAFPLRLAVVEPLVKPRVALLGDAAHGVHPLAGQGVNLGLRDARDLALILDQRGPRDCGDFFLLRRYERGRKADILRIQALTDGLLRLFGAQDALVATARNLGLSLVQHQPWLKRALVRQALH